MTSGLPSASQVIDAVGTALVFWILWFEDSRGFVFICQVLLQALPAPVTVTVVHWMLNSTRRPGLYFEFFCIFSSFICFGHEVAECITLFCSLCANADGTIYVFEKDARNVRVIHDAGSSSSVMTVPSSWLHATGASPCASGIVVCDSGHNRIKLLHPDNRTVSNVAGSCSIWLILL
jgi:hypothetical protein